MEAKGTIDVSLDRCLLYMEGTYKLLLELSCKNEKIRYEAVENTEKLLGSEWKQPSDMNAPVQFRDRTFSISLTSKLIASPIYLQANLLKFDEEKAVGLVRDGFTMFAHGKVLLYPKKRLFDPHKTITHTKYTNRMKLVTVAENSVVRMVLGWLDFSVTVNVAQPPLQQHQQKRKEKDKKIELETVISRYESSEIDETVSDSLVETSLPVENVLKKVETSSAEKERKFKSTTKIDSITVNNSEIPKDETKTVSVKNKKRVKISSNYRTKETSNSDISIDNKLHQGSPRIQDKIKKKKTFKVSHNNQAEAKSIVDNKRADGLNSFSEDNIEPSRKSVKKKKKLNVSQVIQKKSRSKVDTITSNVDNEPCKTPSIFYLDCEKKIFARSLKTKRSDHKVTQKDAERTNSESTVHHNGSGSNDQNSSSSHYSASSTFSSHEVVNGSKRPIVSQDSAENELDFLLPDFDAVKNLLPNYYALSRSGVSEIPSVSAHVPIIEPTHEESSDGGSRKDATFGSQDVKKYKITLERMAKHIADMQFEINKLQHEKSQLFAKLYYAADDLYLGEEKIAASGGEKTDVLKRRFEAENSETMELQQRIHFLQSEIIKKNETEISYLELQKAHQQQQNTLQQTQTRLGKMKLLEKTCRDQEKVIEALEKELGNKGKKSTGQVATQEMSESKKIKTVTRSLKEIDGQLDLMSELEHARNANEALRNQIETNAKNWIKEKTLLEQRLAEYRNFDYECPGSDRTLKPLYLSSPVHRTHWRSLSDERGRSFPRYSYHLGNASANRLRSYPFS